MLHVVARFFFGPPHFLSFLVCASQSTEDTRIGDVRPLLPPACLCEELPLTAAAKQTVIAARQAVQAVLDDTDDRLVVIVGPCSIHDIKAAKDYGNIIVPSLAALART